MVYIEAIIITGFLMSQFSFIKFTSLVMLYLNFLSTLLLFYQSLLVVRLLLYMILENDTNKIYLNKYPSENQ